MAGYDLAAMIISRTAMENCVSVPDLCKARNTRTRRALRKAVIAELRQRTTLSWAEINDLMHRQASCRRA